MQYRCRLYLNHTLGVNTILLDETLANMVNRCPDEVALLLSVCRLDFDACF